MDFHCKRSVLGLLVVAIFSKSIHTVSSPASNEFLWQPLLEISNETWSRALLPNYIDLRNKSLLINSNISSECRDSIQSVIKSFDGRQTWAFKFFNSWARFPPVGSLSGTLTDYGDYDQCLGVNQDPRSSIEVNYCLLNLMMPMPRPMPKHHNYHHKTNALLPSKSLSLLDQKFNLTGSIYQDLAESASVFYYVYIQIGVCLPKSCSINDVKNIASNELKKIGGIQLNDMIFDSGTATINRQSLLGFEPSFFQIIAILFLLTMVLVTLSAAVYDRIVVKKNNRLNEQILLWFSPVANIRKLICTKSSEELDCIHGIRVITIVWIIICHTLEWNNLNIFRNVFGLKQRLSSLENQPLFKGHYSVDTFFYLSGLLTSYVTIKLTKGSYKNFHSLSFMVLRYLRLTPQLAIFMLLFTLLPPMFDGPLWLSYMNKVTSKCSKTWWHNLIYMHNMLDIENICAIHTWYLAADMQLHWMSLIPMVVCLRYHRFGATFIKWVILTCIGISSWTLFFSRLPPGSVITSKNDFLDENGTPSDFIQFFYKPWNHANVFFIGFLFGLYLQRNNGKNVINSSSSVKLKKKTKYLYWLMALLGYLFCMYSTTPWLYGRPYSPYWSSFLFPLNRTVWALVLSLVIWLCITNNGSIVGQFLSWSGFRPFSRMTYSVYLTHAWVLYVALGTRRELINTQTSSIIMFFFGIITTSYLLGFIFTILFETPLIHAIEYLKNRWIDHCDPDGSKQAQSIDIAVNGNEMKLLNKVDIEELSKV